MKSLKFLLVLVFTCTVLMSYSQKTAKPFVGLITYDISYVGEGLDAATKAQMPMEAVVKVRNEQISVENISAMYSMTIISDVETKSTIMLFDMMGQKMAVNMSKEDLSEEMSNEDVKDVKDLQETKTIAGYKCNKYEMPFGEGSDDYVTLYVAKELNVSSELNKKGLLPANVEGAVLEVVIYQGDIEVTYRAKEVKKGKAKKSDFMITDDYTEMTPEEFKSMMGQ